MLIHANWQSDALFLWADDSAPTETNAARLRDLLGDLSSDALLASVAQDVSINLWLPGATEADGLTQQSINALRFSASEAMDLLLSLPAAGSETLGDSVRYWVRLAQFVVVHLRHRQFYPTVVHHDDRLEGAWRLLISDTAQMERLERFASAMPPSCRAIVGDEVPEPFDLIEAFLAATSDALIRRATSNDSFFSRVHGLAESGASTPDVRWMSALLGGEPRIRGDNAENLYFSEQVQAWTGRLDETRSGARWQLGFELLEPGDEDGAAEEDEASIAASNGADAVWHVVFRLHPQDDSEDEPVDATAVWSEAGGSLGILGRAAAERRSLLLAELARSAQYFPPVSRILGTTAPAGVTLSTAEAHSFLRQWAGELKAREFEVRLPEWATDRDRQLGLVMALRPADEDDEETLNPPFESSGRRSTPFEISSQRVGLESLLRFDWRVAVGGVEITPDEFDAMVAQQSALIRFRGKWLQIDPALATKTSEFVRRKSGGKLTLGEAFRTAYGFAHEQPDVPIIGLTGTSWIQQLLEQSPAAKIESIAQPEAFQGVLRPYQTRGLQWMAFLDRLGIGGCLADDMGLGKTIQLIALLLHERTAADSKSGPTLLFAPTSVVGNWIKELQRFAPSLKIMLHHGPERAHGDGFIELARKQDVVITSYALAYRDLDDLAKVPWHRIALDEAQKIKNPSAASSVAIRSLTAPRRVALTGTPIENHLSELWSIMDLLNPGLLGSARDFREKFAVPIEKLSDQERGHHLRKMIRPFVLRRTKTDPELAGDLPEKMEMKVFCSLTPEQAAMYERVTAEMLTQIDAATGIRRRGLILAVLTRLKQICDHPSLLTKDALALDGRSGKCERLVEMLEEVLEEGEAALVFTQYREMGHLLEKILPERLKTPVQFLHGGTPQKQRDEMVRIFQEPETKTRIFILSLRAGGLGLNLTAASHVFHFDRWWNPAVENQATDRAHRIGQSKKVQVHKFVSIGTVEERIDRLLSEKTQLADNIVGSGDEWLTNLSTSELKEYLTLSAQSVAEF